MANKPEEEFDFVTSTGRGITIDLNAITIAEFRGLFDDKSTRENDDLIISKACGLTADEYTSLGYKDYHALNDLFFKKVREPLADPN